jgi:Tfp pilus assembly protein PilN
VTAFWEVSRRDDLQTRVWTWIGVEALVEVVGVLLEENNAV